jgi:predicted metal-dependent phosphoesterase TrpH
VHTTASDGRASAETLVASAAHAGITTLGVTDHDTVAALPAVTALAEAAGIVVVPGIEITAVWRGADVHVLGYFLDPASMDLASFLERQRAARVERLRRMADRLAELGCPVDITGWLEQAGTAGPDAVGRPHLARKLVEAGHAADIGDAFGRFLGFGAPAFVPRLGPSPFDVVRAIEQAGGLSSLAHPATLGHDELIPILARAGLGAIEVFHPDHDAATIDHYRALARRHELAASGGSDYHADPARGAPTIGAVLLPVEEYAALEHRHRCSTRTSNTRERPVREG